MKISRRLAGCSAWLLLAAAAPAQVWEVGEEAVQAPAPQVSAHFGAVAITGDFDCGANGR